MNWVDGVVIALLAFGLLLGLRCGLIRAVTTVLGVFIALVIARQHYLALGAHLDFIENQEYASVAAFGILFMGVYVALQVGGAMVRKVMRYLSLGWADTLAGGVLGVGVAGLIMGTAVPHVSDFGGDRFKTGIRESSTAQLLVDSAPAVLGLLPVDAQTLKDLLPDEAEKLKDLLSEELEQLKDLLPEELEQLKDLLPDEAEKLKDLLPEELEQLKDLLPEELDQLREEAKEQVSQQANPRAEDEDS